MLVSSSSIINKTMHDISTDFDGFLSASNRNIKVFQNAKENEKRNLIESIINIHEGVIKEVDNVWTRLKNDVNNIYHYLNDDIYSIVIFDENFKILHNNKLFYNILDSKKFKFVEGKQLYEIVNKNNEIYVGDTETVDIKGQKYSYKPIIFYKNNNKYFYSKQRTVSNGDLKDINFIRTYREITKDVYYYIKYRKFNEGGYKYA